MTGTCGLQLSEHVWTREALSMKRAAMPMVYVQGEISATSVEGIRRIYESARIIPPIMEIDSPGGDVAAAMEIGRVLRKHGASVHVPPNGVCASACVLLIAGAVSRTYFGSVVIHRPYRAAVGERGNDAAQRDYAARRAAILSYLEEMNVPSALWDEMQAVPPEQGRELSEADRARLGLSDEDPVFAEERAATNAGELGLTMQEYYVRKRQHDACMDEIVARGAIGAMGSRMARDCRARYPLSRLDLRRANE